MVKSREPKSKAEKTQETNKQNSQGFRVDIEMHARKQEE